MLKPGVVKEELGLILEKHELWLQVDPMGERADLSGADLRNTNLSGANLQHANLYRADLWKANLSGADLYAADLRDANLCGADLSGACLYTTNLCSANLSGADLSGADLREANLSRAGLRKAKLYDAYIQGANFYAACLWGAKDVPFIPLVCPDKGSFTAFKSASNYVVELLVPEDALRSSATTRKCRCSKAKVISITNVDGTDSGLTSVCSNHDHGFIYKIGETVEVPDFNLDRWTECSTGIHFFINRQEAVNYYTRR